MTVKQKNSGSLLLAVCLGVALAAPCWAQGTAPLPNPGTPGAVTVVPGMPPVMDPTNLYSEAAAGRFSPAVAGAMPRVYVPNVKSNDVYVIDPATFKVVDRFKVGINPQHVVPSWDLQTL
ncbi:MAG: hypothetical protein H0X11_09235, partial [Betaproteobacteria bacterium]|nr:hypothetical protein [Betaproteobacteria bacterium]